MKTKKLLTRISDIYMVKNKMYNILDRRIFIFSLTINMNLEIVNQEYCNYISKIFFFHINLTVKKNKKESLIITNVITTQLFISKFSPLFFTRISS